jgi:hypothetical protein
MVNASLNWSSITGLLMIGWWLVAVPATGFQIWFLLTRRADTSPSVIGKSLMRFAIGFGRLLGLPLVGGILFFQGWRLDPILQFAVAVLTIGLIVESLSSILDDYQAWRHRLGRASAVIPVAEQPDERS